MKHFQRPTAFHLTPFLWFQNDSHKHTALHYASRFGHTDCIEVLLRARADPNMRNNDGSSPLHWAASNGTAASCIMLLKHGADPSLRNRDGMTPLELATHFNNAQSIHALRQGARLGPEEHPVAAVYILIHTHTLTYTHARTHEHMHIHAHTFAQPLISRMFEMNP
mmetsp:Transcript_57083/g.150428  ORF Transcript_57083/g.150428 Transcript_57083/m.150428 type:complete len:166 (-) Transcript_57083:90-587(-)